MNLVEQLAPARRSSTGRACSACRSHALRSVARASIRRRRDGDLLAGRLVERRDGCRRAARARRVASPSRRAARARGGRGRRRRRARRRRRCAPPRRARSRSSHCSKKKRAPISPATPAQPTSGGGYAPRVSIVACALRVTARTRPSTGKTRTTSANGPSSRSAPSPQSAATRSASTTSRRYAAVGQRDERVGVAELAPARGQSVPRDEREEPFHREGS